MGPAVFHGGPQWRVRRVAPRNPPATRQLPALYDASIVAGRPTRLILSVVAFVSNGVSTRRTRFPQDAHIQGTSPSDGPARGHRIPLLGGGGFAPSADAPHSPSLLPIHC